MRRRVTPRGASPVRACRKWRSTVMFDPPTEQRAALADTPPAPPCAPGSAASCVAKVAPTKTFACQAMGQPGGEEALS